MKGQNVVRLAKKDTKKEYREMQFKKVVHRFSHVFVDIWHRGYVYVMFW